MASQSGDEPNFASSGSASGSGSISSVQNDNSSPLWNYVTKLEKRGATGKTWNYRCNICGETRNGSYTRVNAHLLQISGEDVAICKKVTKSQKLEMLTLLEEWEKRKKQGASREVPMPSQCQS
ncbi:hypothetical protein HRI_000169000 [Hibiscus trionum]|uniref:BED-type domain-containing protein n=1 Tax=Hibiscus trionum TaxID=183268 RepID=A0A9W7LHZ5_HIBTR|nr:hypothetical protein HRI_000169000 [Hibiscus trionum]